MQQAIRSKPATRMPYDDGRYDPRAEQGIACTVVGDDMVHATGVHLGSGEWRDRIWGAGRSLSMDGMEGEICEGTYI
jgi:hypothetical protein